MLVLIEIIKLISYNFLKTNTEKKIIYQKKFFEKWCDSPSEIHDAAFSLSLHL